MPQQALRRGEPSQKHGSNQVLCQIELYTAAFVKKSWSLKFSVCMFRCIPIYIADLYRAMCSKTPGAAFTNPRLAEHLPGQTQPQIQGTNLPGHSPHHLQWHHQPQGKSGWFKITAIFIFHIIVTNYNNSNHRSHFYTETKFVFNLKNFTFGHWAPNWASWVDFCRHHLCLGQHRNTRRWSCKTAQLQPLQESSKESPQFNPEHFTPSLIPSRAKRTDPRWKHCSEKPHTNRWHHLGFKCCSAFPAASGKYRTCSECANDEINTKGQCNSC